MNTRTGRLRRSLIGVGGAIVLLLAVLFFPQHLFSQGAVSQTQRAKETPSRDAAVVAAASSATTHTDALSADVELGRRIAHEIGEGKFASARWGVEIISLRDGHTLYARDAERLFTPASNMKLYTTAAALDLLGADYRWRTSIYAASAPDADGNIDGDLTLYGRGAPDLSARVTKQSPFDHLKQFADELYARGVRRVRGGVVGDESYFRGEALGDGWQWNDVQWYFGAEPSALSIGGNEVTVNVAPAAKVGAQADVHLIPATDYVHITDDADTAERGTKPTLGITRGLSDNEVRVWGNFPAGAPGYGVRLSVHRPALWAARLLSDALKSRGIAVEGEARVRDARMSEKFDAGHSIELASVSSQTLGEIVRATNKESINLNAELILRTLGKELGTNFAPDPDPLRMLTRGDDAAGDAVIRRWLQQSAGANVDHLALHDGSGLSRLDLITPDATVRLLSRMAQSPAAKVFYDSLPLAGRDGTLEYRLRDTQTAGHIAAKTGSLTYIHSLSGYATTSEGETLAFSIICDDETGRASATRAIDTICALLVKYPFFSR